MIDLISFVSGCVVMAATMLVISIIVCGRRRARRQASRTPAHRSACECGHPYCYHFHKESLVKNANEFCSLTNCGCVNYTAKATTWSDSEFRRSTGVRP
ncbi:MAG: hypothetical protein ACRD3E_15860 [Terriglobales bacterium]